MSSLAVGMRWIVEIPMARHDSVANPGNSDQSTGTLDRVVSGILDESISSRLRAVRLFEFQVALFHSSSFAKLLLSEQDRGPTKRLRTARIFAAVKLLEQIESDLLCTNSVLSIRTLAEHQEY